MKRIRDMSFIVLFIFTLIGCNESSNNSFQGYIEGEYVYLASSRAGKVENISVERGQTIEKGMPLFELDAEYEQNQLQEAQHELNSVTAKLQDMEKGKRPEEVAMVQAQLNQAKAKSVNATTLLQRYKTLIKSGGVSQQEFDNAQAQAEELNARVAELTSQLQVYYLSEREDLINAQHSTVKAAQARVAQAMWELKQKNVQAPRDGLVYDVLYRQGEWVSAGMPVIQLLPPENIKIRFFISESLLGKKHLKEQVQIMADGRTEPFNARITYISENVEYTPPVIYSNESRSKLVFMVEAVPTNIEIANSLHPGQPVSVNLL